MRHIYSFTKQTDSNAILVGQARAIEVLVNVMEKHIEDAKICRGGCGALCNITYDSGKYGNLTSHKMCSILRKNNKTIIKSKRSKQEASK